MTKKGELTPGQKQTALAGGASALALAAAVAISGIWEGKSNKPYLDIVNVWTVCYGETRVEMRTYTDAECTKQHKKMMIGFLKGVEQRNPRIPSDPYQWASHAALASNIGQSAYNRSSVAALYQAGREIEACRFIGNYRLADGKVRKGLVLRRNGDATRLGEIELCLTPHPGLGR